MWLQVLGPPRTDQFWTQIISYLSYKWSLSLISVLMHSLTTQRLVCSGTNKRDFRRPKEEDQLERHTSFWCCLVLRPEEMLSLVRYSGESRKLPFSFSLEKEKMK